MPCRGISSCGLPRNARMRPVLDRGTLQLKQRRSSWIGGVPRLVMRCAGGDGCSQASKGRQPTRSVLVWSSLDYIQMELFRARLVVCWSARSAATSFGTAGVCCFALILLSLSLHHLQVVGEAGLALKGTGVWFGGARQCENSRRRFVDKRRFVGAEEGSLMQRGTYIQVYLGFLQPGFARWSCSPGPGVASENQTYAE